MGFFSIRLGVFCSGGRDSAFKPTLEFKLSFEIQAELCKQPGKSWQSTLPKAISDREPAACAARLKARPAARAARLEAP